MSIKRAVTGSQLIEGLERVLLGGGGGGGFGRGGGPGGGPGGFGMLAIDICLWVQARRMAKTQFQALRDFKNCWTVFGALTPQFFALTASKLGHQSLDQVQRWLAEECDGCEFC